MASEVAPLAAGALHMPVQPPQAAPVAPALPQHRIDAFRTQVAARLRAGASLALLAREQEALAATLDPAANPTFLGQMAAAFVAEMREQQPNEAYAMNADAALAEMAVILKNRTADARAFRALLADETFLAAARAEAAAPAPAAKPYALPPAKIEEAVRRLVQESDPAGAEPSIHVEAAAMGQRMVHQALANMFRPKGTLLPYLTLALAQAWPEATAGEITNLAQGWLKARHDPAHSTADGMAPGGEIYTQAMTRANALHAQKMAALGQQSSPLAVNAEGKLAQNAPAITVTVPTAPTQKLAAAPSLMMDSLN